MKANWLERMIVNSPIRLLAQGKIILPWIKSKVDLPPGGTFLEIGCGRGAGEQAEHENRIKKEYGAEPVKSHGSI